MSVTPTLWYGFSLSALSSSLVVSVFGRESSDEALATALRHSPIVYCLFSSDDSAPTSLPILVGLPNAVIEWLLFDISESRLLEAARNCSAGNEAN